MLFTGKSASTVDLVTACRKASSWAQWISVMRGLAVVSRSGGLVAHIAEERASGSARLIERLAKQHVRYRDPPADGA